MTPSPPRRAAVVLLCRDLDACCAFFDELGFALASIWPADAPRVAVLQGHDLLLRLERADHDGGGHLRLPGTGAQRIAPNGARIEFDEPAPSPAVPPAMFVVSHRDDTPWHTGRAGMQYRDLIPGRQGGALIASHIRIPRGGPVPDYVHYHDVTAQVIHCIAGWVRVVYEDQGQPFELHAGDTVLQPPQIRHRVLACSDGLEVVEVTCPAEHPTHTDRQLVLPTAAPRPERRFAGQRFVRHHAASAAWQAAEHRGCSAIDTGIAAATDGAITARTLRATAAAAQLAGVDTTGLRFWFVRQGALRVAYDDATAQLGVGDACALPSRGRWSAHADEAFELFEVAIAPR